MHTKIEIKGVLLREIAGTLDSNQNEGLAADSNHKTSSMSGRKEAPQFGAVPTGIVRK